MSFRTLTGICFLLTAGAKLAKFGVDVAIVLRAFFNTGSAPVHALTPGLRKRNHLILIYSLTVFTTGTLPGLAVLDFESRSGRANAYAPVRPGRGNSPDVALNPGTLGPYSSRRCARTTGPTP